MGDRVLIQYGGVVYDPRGWAADWLDPNLSQGADDERRRILAEGAFVWESSGEPLPPARARFFRAEILGTYDGMPRAYDPTTAGPVRPYIPGLMNHGTIPMLGGPPKGGRSTLANQLAAALIIPDRRFLDAFEPAQMTEAEGRRHVLLLNGENPPDEVHEDLLRLGLEYEPWTADAAPFYSVPGVDRVLFVEHLDQLGSGDVFDMTSDEQREFWEYRILKATHATGEPTPLTVIADGVTAMLNADTTRYGRWFAGFKKLLRALDIPNGLAVGHSGLNTGHLMNGVESMAGPDGLWMYDAREPDKNPNAPRYFWTTPRLRGPRVERSQVVMDDSGMLRLLTPEESARSGSRPAGDDTSWRWEAMRARLHDAGSAGLYSFEVAERGPGYRGNMAELERRKQSGEVVARSVTSNKSRGVRWWLAEFAPSA